MDVKTGSNYANLFVGFVENTLVGMLIIVLAQHHVIVSN